MVEAGLGTPLPQQYSLYALHVEESVVLHPLSPSTLFPLHLVAWHVLHSLAFRYEWQQSGQEVQGGDTSAQTRVLGMSQQDQLSGQVRGSYPGDTVHC